MSFTHLQVMSTNSLMKSIMKTEDLIDKAKQEGYQALALTDHNVLIGAIEFYEKAIKNNIKPIIGLTLDVQGIIDRNRTYPLLLLARNFRGYQDLNQLSTLYQLSENNRVDLTEVVLRSENLFIISPGTDGEIMSLLGSGKKREAQEVSDYLMANTSSFYLGITLQGVNSETIHNYKEISLPKVALGNVQYLDPSQELPTKVVRVLENEMSLGPEHQAQINAYLSKDEGDFSLKSPEGTFQAFKEAGFEEAARETSIIMEQIDIQISLGQPIMPSYPVPDHETADSFLKKLCLENLNKRVEHVSEDYYERLEKELTVISSMGFSDYFLIVWDIMVYAHKKNMFTGSGRGSAAGSLVAYLLEITNVDPLKFDLLFERFLNKDRASMPDIDLDFPDTRREEILQYIHQKYGHDKVAQIGTIGTYGAKSAVRDVNRVYGQSQDEIKKWANAIPSGPEVNLTNALEAKQFKDLVFLNEKNQHIYQVAKQIEGSNRHVSTHAAAVVISDHPLVKQLPLQKGSSNINLTQFTMGSVEEIGLLKLDVLGLRNLTTLSDCLDFIPYENNGQAVDIDAINFNDQKTLEIFRLGQTDGVFQFESPGIRRVLRKLQPSSFEDVVAVNALYRPGPMEQIDTFIGRKNGNEPIRYPHEDLKDILEVTYGIMVYQEQVMQVASKLAGYTLNEADLLRRAISKKDHEAIEQGRKTFVEGATKNGYSREVALEVYGYIEQFADYGFNRSHAVAYSKVAYQLAYVKAHYPASFYAAVMNASSKDKVKSFVTEAKQQGVKFQAPDINKSYQGFIIKNDHILFGFDGIIGLPRNFIKEIISERKMSGEFRGLIPFLSRIDRKWLKTEYIQPLIYSGACDGFSESRASQLESLDSTIESIEMSHGNTELFEIFSPSITDREEYSDEEKMNQEFEVTGFYFTSEPGEKYKHLRENSNIVFLQNTIKDKYVSLLVVVEKITSIQTKNGEPMSFVEVVDHSAKATLTLFPKVHRRYIKFFKEGDTILVEGKVEQIQPNIKIIANKITNAEEMVRNAQGNQSSAAANKNKKKVLYIRFKSLQHEMKKLNALQEVLKQHRGSIPVVIYDEETKTQKPFKKEYNIQENSKLFDVLNKMFGNENIVLKEEKGE